METAWLYLGKKNTLQLGKLVSKGKEGDVNGRKESNRTCVVGDVMMDLGICRVERGVACSLL